MKLKNYSAQQNRKRVNYDQSLLHDRHHGFDLSRSADRHSYLVYPSRWCIHARTTCWKVWKWLFFVVILDSKYSKMTPKFVKQKSHWLHSSIKFANPVFSFILMYPTLPLSLLLDCIMIIPCSFALHLLHQTSWQHNQAYRLPISSAHN